MHDPHDPHLLAAKPRRPLPFGIRLDKWRSPPAHVDAGGVEGGPVLHENERDPLMLGTGGAGTAAWRRQDSGAVDMDPDWDCLHEPEQDHNKQETHKHRRLSIVVPDTVPSPLLKRDGGSRSPVRSVTSRSVTSPTRSIASPRKRPALLNIMAAAKMKCKGSLTPLPVSLPLPKKEKSDTEWCMRKMIELLDNPKNMLSHGFNETDAKTIGLVCQHLRIEQGEIFAPAGTPCEHVAIILDGKLAAYHRTHLMETHEAGTHVGTQCLTADDSSFTMTLIAEEDTFVALLPAQKLLSYIQDLEPAREEKIMNYCFEVLFTANLESNHQCEVFDSAALIQNCYRGHVARKNFWRIRDRLESPSVNVIIRVWRGHRARRWLWIIVPKSVLTIQCAYRRRLASSLLSNLQEQRDERLLRSAMRRHDSHSAEDSGINVGESAPPESEQGEPQGHDRFTALKRWMKAALARCFGRWRTWILVLNGKLEMGQSAIKQMMYGGVYACFRCWAALLASYGDSVTPSRSHPGLFVGLSKEGREYEFQHGDRLEGDTECGVLIEPVLSNKSVWRVRWLSSGKKGTYLTGSLGRYHLRMWKDDRSGNVEVGGDGAAAQEEQSGFSKIKEALNHHQGHRLSVNVTAPFGGTIKMPCPRDSPWNIIVVFPTRCVHASVMVEVQGIEASSFDASKCAFGNIVSPVVEVRPRQNIQCFKMYSLVIPHRAVPASLKHLALYFWPENRSGAERIHQNVTFDDDACRAEVDLFGVFCVVATIPSINEIVFSKVRFASEGRDVTGRQITSVFMSKSFKGTVYMYPKAFLDSPVGLPVPTSSQWMTMPRFPIPPGVFLSTVRLAFAVKMESVRLTSWSGRTRWKTRPLRMDFEGIVQPVAGQTIGNKEPVVWCQCSLLDDGPDEKAIIKFGGPHCFRMQIKSAHLKVVLHTRGGQVETYLRSLQARESLLDIRKWVAKACLVEKCSLQQLEWLKSLRFFQEGEPMSLEMEVLESAGLMLPAIEMRPVAKTHESYGTAEQVRELGELLRKELEVPYSGPKIFSSKPPLASETRNTPFVGSVAELAGKADQHHHGRFKIGPFEDCEALVLGRPWSAPNPLPPQTVRGAPGSVPPTPISVATPKWSPRVKMVGAPIQKLDANGPDRSVGKLDVDDTPFRQDGSMSCVARSSELVRALAASKRPLDELLSWRPNQRPAMKSGNHRGLAQQLRENHDHVTPRRPASARFHSGRQIRTLESKASDLSARMEEALRLQLVHKPGRTLKQRESTTKAILQSPDIPNLCLRLDGAIAYQRFENEGQDESRRGDKRWRPASARPHRAPIPNYLLHDFE